MTDELMEGQISFFDPDLWFSKMSKDCFPQTTAKISESSLKNSRELPKVTPQFLDCRRERIGLMRGAFWETDGLSLGDYTTVSFGVSPSVAVVSVLSSILEANPHPKYFLSAKACQGILNRSQKRGKELPQTLKEALEQQVTRYKFGGGNETYIKSNGKLGTAGKGALIQKELSSTIGVTQSQTLFATRSGPCFSQFQFDEYRETNVSASIKEAGGNIGGGERNPCDTIGSLCARDYKGVGNQYVNEGKVIVQHKEQ